MRFESLLNSFCNDFMAAVNNFLLKSSMKSADISQVILIGGAFKTPHLLKMLKGSFPQVHSPVDLDEVAAKGAAMQAQRLMDQVELGSGRMDGLGLLQDVSLQLQGKQFTMAKSTPIPFKKTFVIDASAEPFTIRIMEENEICRISLPSSDAPGKLTVDADVSKFVLGIEYSNEIHQVDLLKN
jgi:molecular chaperone DnaK (HSP70)